MHSKVRRGDSNRLSTPRRADRDIGTYLQASLSKIIYSLFNNPQVFFLHLATNEMPFLCECDDTCCARTDEWIQNYIARIG